MREIIFRLVAFASISSASCFVTPAAVSVVKQPALTVFVGRQRCAPPVEAMARRRARSGSAAQRFTNAAVDITSAAEAVTSAMDEDAAFPTTPPSADVLAASFGRSKDVLNTGDKVTARQVVNAMGRWKTRHEWNDARIGRKALLDDYRNGDYYEEDMPKLQTDFNKPMEFYIARRPQFLDFCERYGLVARWVHRENVGSLPFPDDAAGRALAASVGATVAELNAEPVDETAADVLFDAISDTGLVGFAEEEEVDRKRASFLTSDGGFNANAFGSSLTRSRVHTAAALSGVRVVPALIAFGIGYHYMPQLMEMRAEIEAQLALNWRLHPWTCLLPILPVGGLMYQAVTFVPPRERADFVERPRTLNYQERAILHRDETYRERMRLKKSGGLEEAVTPKVGELFREQSYLMKMLSGSAGMRWGPAPTDATASDADNAVRVDGVPLPEKTMGGLAASDDAGHDEELLRKVQIRPSRASGPAFMFAQAVWVWWLALIPYIIITKSM